MCRLRTFLQTDYLEGATARYPEHEIRESGYGAKDQQVGEHSQE